MFSDELSDELLDLFPAVEVAVNFPGNADGRSLIAGAEARYALQGEAAIVGGLTDIDAQELLQCGKNGLGIIDLADNRVADLDRIFGSWLIRQAGIEGQAVIDDRELYRQLFGNIESSLFRHVVLFDAVLHIEQDAEDLCRILVVRRHDRIDFGSGFFGYSERLCLRGLHKTTSIKHISIYYIQFSSICL